MERHLYIYVDTAGEVALAGELWTRRRGKESATFRYAPAWLTRPDRFALGPDLPLDEAPHHTPQGMALFGPLSDSAPDRWGRMLMRKWARTGTPGASLSEMDFLLRVNDNARLGALRFAESEGGAFQAPDDVTPIPPLVQLPALLDASAAVLADNETAAALRQLLAPGASLGGARPKASVRDAHGHLRIAKFPARSDEWDTVRWEAVALTLAQQAGIAVPQFRLESVGGHPVLLLGRFDRAGRERIPFLSGMAALGALHHETRSYLELVDVLRQQGARPVDDMHELWRRIVFNVLISNVDDHLRNHGFLHQRGRGWALSPAYDLNPTPADEHSGQLQTAIDLDDTNASLALALDQAQYFEIDGAMARAIIAEVAETTTNWRHVAKDYDLPSREAARMVTAFEHEELMFAERLR